MQRGGRGKKKENTLTLEREGRPRGKGRKGAPANQEERGGCGSKVGGRAGGRGTTGEGPGPGAGAEKKKRKRSNAQKKGAAWWIQTLVWERGVRKTEKRPLALTKKRQRPKKTPEAPSVERWARRITEGSGTSQRGKGPLMVVGENVVTEGRGVGVNREGKPRGTGRRCCSRKKGSRVLAGRG